MKVVILLNEKGGVGKTTLTTTLGAGLAIMGYRVLLVDTDPQGHATISFGIKKSPAFYDLVVRNADLGKVATLVSPKRYVVPDKVEDVKGKLYLVPGNLETRGIPVQTNDDLAMLRIVAGLERANAVDFVLFDTSPTPSLIHKMLLIASDALIYPTEANMLSMDGLAESIKHVKDANRTRVDKGLPQIDLLGVVPTRVRGTLEHGGNLDDLEAAFGKATLWDPIPQRTVWEECTRERLSIFAYAPFEKAAKHAQRFVDRFIDEIGVQKKNA